MPKKPMTIDITIHKVFQFCGDGAGIPGLPHEVTAKQAEDLGLLDELKAAVANGNYKPIVSAAEPAAEGE